VEGSSGAIFTFQENMKYPSTLYNGLPTAIKYLVIPMSLLTYIPTSLLLDKYDWKLIWTYIIFLIILSIVSHINWQKALKSYSSASS